MKLSAIENWVVDGKTKGTPADMAPIRLSEIGEANWSVLRGDLPFPVATIRESAVRHNSGWMRRFIAQSGAEIAPHGKTTMCPQLFQLQLDDGAWSITVATVQQLKVCRDFGGDRVLMANQLSGAPEIRYVLAELKRDPDFRFLCFVDSACNVAELAAAARTASPGRPLEVLLEIGFSGGRTGCRTTEDALAVAREVRRSDPHLILRGIAGFEGLISGPTAADTEKEVREFVDSIAAIAKLTERERLFAEDGPLLLTAGGSGFYDIVIDRLSHIGLARETIVVIRSGCYLTHDVQMYRRLFDDLRRRNPSLADLGPGLRPALEVWARVQSRPEASKAILGVGKRDISFDIDLPTPLLWYREGMAHPQPVPQRCHVVSLNDQHCHLAIAEDSPLRFGDLISFGVSHPCTTFDKWQILYMVDDDLNVIGAMKTFF